MWEIFGKVKYYLMTLYSFDKIPTVDYWILSGQTDIPSITALKSAHNLMN